MRAEVEAKRTVGGGTCKPPKAKVQTKRLVAKKAPKRKGSTDPDSKKQPAEALEREKAISEILRLISSSPRNLKPVLHAVAERALKLCDATDTTLFLSEGDQLRAAVRFSSTRTAFEEGQLMPLTRGSVTGRAVVDRAVVHVEDLATAPEEEFPLGREIQRRVGLHAVLSVPLMHEDRAIGAIALWRMEARRFTDRQIALVKTFADQAAIAIENVRLFNETKEALEQQTATSEILRVISQSPTDVQPVFDTIADAAMNLCGGTFATVVRYDGELVHIEALASSWKPEEADAIRRRYPMPPSRGTIASRAVLIRDVVNIRDVQEDAEYTIRDVARSAGYRSAVGVPLMLRGVPIGAIGVGRPQPGMFPEKQIALLKTFADQAVIAIENVRLFTETKEALERQTATADILRVISDSPTSTDPVFDAILESGARLCAADLGLVVRYDAGMFWAVATRTPDPAFDAFVREPKRWSAKTGLGRIEQTRQPVNIPDLLDDEAYREADPGRLASLKLGGVRSWLGVPMLREGELIGAILVYRKELRPFGNRQLALLQTFADQAVIAIENVRLFNETKEALERQIATSEILRVISQSPRDVQPVFDTIAAAALKLCNASSAHVVTFDGELIHLAALANMNPEVVDALRQMFPRPPSRDIGSSRAVLTRGVVAIPDVLQDPEYRIKSAALAGDYRSVLSVPLMREGGPIGAIGVARPQAGPFPDKQIALLQTFADQAVIAIENVRLFTELEARTRELTRSVGELKALGEVGQAVSSTLDLETVLSTIVSRAAHLAGMDGGSIWEYDESREEFHLRATDRLPDKLVEALRAAPIRKGEGALGRLAVTSEPVQIRDIADERTYQSRLRQVTIRAGFRSVLAVPLLREDHLLGALAVNRASTGEFAPEVIDLLKTFATQSALAIQNARLFREIEDKSRQLEIASQHKSEFLANMSHELRTPLNAIIGFSEVLSERMFGEINEKQAEYIGDILQSGQHLLSLINDILDLSKIEAGRMELELTDFDLPGSIEQTVMLVRERALRRGITLGRTIGERLGSIRADERKIKQVLLNLLSNALKFTPEGGKVDVRAAVNDGAAEISVTDTGIGISAEDQEAVFEEFRQVGTASKKVEGTGLGLAISKKFIELHGGKIWVTSQVGTGSTFAFTLPLR